MKKLAMILLSCAMVFGMTGCSQSEEQVQKDNYEKVNNAGVLTEIDYLPMGDDSEQQYPVIYDQITTDDGTTSYKQMFALVDENGDEKLYYFSYNEELGTYNGNCYVYYYVSDSKTLTNDLYFGIKYNVDDNVNWSATHIYWTSKLGTEEAETTLYDTGVDETYKVDELKNDMEEYLESVDLTLEEIRDALQYEALKYEEGSSAVS